MNTGYLIYQAERTRTAAEQREVDRSNAQLAACNHCARQAARTGGRTRWQ